MERKTLKKIESVFSDALEKIEEQLLSQADLHGMTLDGLLSDFNNRDQKKYRDYVNKNYERLMQSDEKYQEFIDEFFPAYDYAKVNRLMQVRSDIFSALANETIKADLNGKLNSGLEDIIKRTYNSNSNTLMQLVVTGDFSPLSQAELQEMLNYPWSGKSFSNRLWGNISKLEQNLSQSIVNAVQSGEGVEEALRTMRNDEGISDMFKQEKDKFNRAIENLVRTEYAHFAVEGINKSLDDAGITNKQSWSAEDERVCSVCGGRHGKLITDGWVPPYHTRCRCSLIPKMPDLSEDIDLIYEEMFGDTLDEFAKEQFGIKLTHPKASSKKEDKSTKGDIIINDSIEAKTSTDNIKEIKRILSGAPENMQKLWNKYADEFNWISNTEGDYFDRARKGVYLLEKNLTGLADYKDYDVFFHEFAHHIDGLAGRDAGYMMFSHFADEDLGGLIRQESKDYINNLKKDIAKEANLQGLVKGKTGMIIYNGEEMMISGGSVANRHAQNVIKSELASITSQASGDVSDIWEGATKGNVTGTKGHGKSYWSDIYKLPSEAFAEMTSATINNPESLKMIKKYFPKSYDAYLKMVDTILGG